MDEDEVGGDGSRAGGEVHQVAPRALGQLRSSPHASATQSGGLAQNER